MLRDRIEQVEARIRRAAERVGRRPGDVTLIAVTKLFPSSLIREAYALGVRLSLIHISEPTRPY